jgi:regulator of RNase E activity RraB
MLYILSTTEDPTEEDVYAVEASSIGTAVKEAENWGVNDGDTVYVFEVKKGSRKAFKAARGWTFTLVKS